MLGWKSLGYTSGQTPSPLTHRGSVSATITRVVVVVVVVAGKLVIPGTIASNLQKWIGHHVFLCLICKAWRTLNPNT